MFSSFGFPLLQILFSRSCFISSLRAAQRSPTSCCTPGALPALPGCKLSTSFFFFLPKKSKKNEKTPPQKPNHLLLAEISISSLSSQQSTPLHSGGAQGFLPKRLQKFCQKSSFFHVAHDESKAFASLFVVMFGVGGSWGQAEHCSAHPHVLLCLLMPTEAPFIPKSENSLFLEKSHGTGPNLEGMGGCCPPSIPCCCCPQDAPVMLVGVTACTSHLSGMILGHRRCCTWTPLAAAPRITLGLSLCPSSSSQAGHEAARHFQCEAPAATS